MPPETGPSATQTTAATAVASNSGPAARRRSREPCRSSSRNAAVGQRRAEPEDDAETGVVAVGAVADHAGDEHDPDQTTGTAATSRRLGRSPSSHQARNPTTTTCRLPSTVAMPAPTAAMAWCHRTRSTAKNTPAAAASQPVPRGAAAVPSVLARQQQAEHRQRVEAPEGGRSGRLDVGEAHQRGRARDARGAGGRGQRRAIGQRHARPSSCRARHVFTTSGASIGYAHDVWEP